jgi:hypothetical protein
MVIYGQMGRIAGFSYSPSVNLKPVSVSSLPIIAKGDPLL